MAFTSDWLGRYLTHRLGEPVRIESLQKFGRGTSRETWFARYVLHRSGEAVDITLRTDHPAGSVDPTPLDQEYFIYSRLGAAGLPVARALWWEDDTAWAERPFYLREKIDGSWNIPGYSDPDPSYDAVRIAAAKEHLGALAKVHALDWRGLGFHERLLVPRDTSDAVNCYIEGARSRWTRQGEAMPIFLEACEWLCDHAPLASRITLCKGTNGHGEEVFRDGKLVALSDWEEVWLGDPASDFAFMQDFAVPIVRDGVQIWGLEQALDYYGAISECPIPVESVRFYQVIRALNMVVMGRNTAVITHESGGHATIRHAWTSTEVLHICKHVLATAMGILPPLPPELFNQLNETIESQAQAKQ
jgi:aminoglycoside phosphotransferase (APT) family kinase protein